MADDPVNHRRLGWLLLFDLAISGALVVVSLSESDATPEVRVAWLVCSLTVAVRRRFPIGAALVMRFPKASTGPPSGLDHPPTLPPLPTEIDEISVWLAQAAVR